MENVEKWSKYPNFIGLNQYRSIGEEDNLFVKSRQLCSNDPADFNVAESRAVYQNSVKWPPDYAICIKFLDGDEWKKAWVEKIVTEEIAPRIDPRISFKFVKKNEYADVKVTFNFDGYGASLIGTTCRQTDQQSPSMKYGILDFPQSRKFEFNSRVYTVPDNVPKTINQTGSVIKHEFGHVLGKYHEHQNPIDNPIVWDVQKTIKWYTDPTDSAPWTLKDIHNNIFKRLSLSEVDATPFDPKSIMMYTVLPNLTKNGIGFDKMDDYSTLDLEWLRHHCVGTPETDFKMYMKYVWMAVAIIFAIAVVYIFVKQFSPKKYRTRS